LKKNLFNKEKEEKLARINIGIYTTTGCPRMCSKRTGVSTKTGYSVNMLLLRNYLYDHSYIHMKCCIGDY